MDNLLYKALEKTGPCLSSELAETLVTKYGLSQEAARQRVSRGSSGINKLKNLKFPKGASFVYFQKDYRNHFFNRKLNDSILKSNSSYSYALMSILSRGGVVRKEKFLVSCGSPVLQKKKIASSSIMERFIESGVLQEIEVPGVGECIAIPSVYEKIISGDKWVARKARSREITEDIILDAVKTWSKKLGLVSYNKVETIKKNMPLPKFSTFNWDLVGPSYLPHLSKTKDGVTKPGFFVCDILLGIQAGRKAILPFTKKIEATQNIKNAPQCMFMHMADSYTPECFKLLKSKGIIAATPSYLFGKEVADGIHELMKTLSYPAQEGVSSEQYNEIFEKLSFIEGVAGNLRGALFEFIAADILKGIEPFHSIEMNKIIVEDRKRVAECDIVAYRPGLKVCFIECKGHSLDGFVDNDEIKKWLETRIPNIRRHANNHPDWKNIDLEFQLWTTGKINLEGQKILSRMKSEIKKYSINFLDGSDVIREAKALKKNNLVDVLNNHFLST